MMKTEYKIIASMIENNSSVLDVGCDNGTLMEYLNIMLTQKIYLLSQIK